MRAVHLVTAPKPLDEHDVPHAQLLLLGNDLVHVGDCAHLVVDRELLPVGAFMLSHQEVPRVVQLLVPAASERRLLHHDADIRVSVLELRAPATAYPPV